MFSWNCPPAAPHTAIVWSLPITRAATCIRLSHITGLTLPGMIELPGWQVGELDFVEAAARPGAEPADVVGHVEQRDGDRRAAGRGTRPGRRAGRWPRSDWRLRRRECRFRRRAASATRRPNSGCVLMPVPTAVPPAGSSSTASAARRRALDRQLQLPGKAADLLAQAQRRGVGQVRAADLEDLVPLGRPSEQASPGSRSSAGISALLDRPRPRPRGSPWGRCRWCSGPC